MEAGGEAAASCSEGFGGGQAAVSETYEIMSTDKHSERHRKRPVAKQLESPVDAAARGPKGTEVLKGPGGSLGSVRRNSTAGKANWKMTAGKANWNDRPISSCSQALSKASTSGQAAGKPKAAARGPKGTEVLKGPGGSLGSVRRNSTAGKANWNDRPISSCSQALSKASTSGQAAGKPKAAARGPKGTEVKGPGGSLGSVRRSCVQGLNCEGMVRSAIETGQVDHRNACGKKFRVKDGLKVACKELLYKCPCWQRLLPVLKGEERELQGHERL